MDRLFLVGGVVTCGLALVIVSTTLDFVYEGHFEGPFGDFWYFVQQVHNVENGAPWWPAWTSRFNAHPIAVPRIFFYAEVALFSARNVFLQTLNCLFQLVVPFLILGSAWRIRPALPWATRLFLCGVALALSFSATQLPNLIVPWHFHFIACWASTGVAFFALTRLRDRDAETTRRGLWLTLCIIAALAASYSMAAGLLAWPILLAMGLLLHVGPTPLVTVGCTAAVVIATYLGGPLSSAGRSAVNEGTLLWILACLGSPLSKQNLTAGQAQATGGLVASVAALAWITFRKEGRSSTAVLAGALLTFSAGAIVMAGIGRAANWPEWWASRRYNGFTMLFWLALIVLVSLQAEAAGRTAPVWRGLVQGAVVVWLVSVILPAHIAEGAWLVQKMQRVRGANVAFLMDVRDRREYAPILAKGRGGMRVSQKLRPFLREKGIGIFSHGYHLLLGTPIQKAFITVDGSNCAGTIERGTRVGEMLRLEGRAQDRTSRAPVEFLVFTDGTGMIRGIGRTTERRSLLFNLGRPHDAGRIWRGYVPASQAGRMQPWAILADGRACPITSPAGPR